MDTKEFCDKYAVERLNTDCVKWDLLKSRFGSKDLTAMWVADMDFKSCEAVIDALKERIDHGAFGYSFATDSFYKTIINWEKKRHNFVIKREWIRDFSGVVPAIAYIINAFTKVDDSVIILTPVYHPFASIISETKRNLVTSDLVNTDGYYTIDFDDFEKKVVENKVKLFIQCSPHNPVGRVWKEEELSKILDVCKRNNVLCVSDEIHHDLTAFGAKHIPSATVENGKYSDIIITLTAPSKTFNLASMATSFVFISNEKLMSVYDNYNKKTQMNVESNLLGRIAAEVSYKEGQDWLDGLFNVLADNYYYLKDQLAIHLPKAIVSPMEGTYLSWIDFRAYLDNSELKDFTINKCKIACNLGEGFGKAGEGFIRLNLATHPKNVKLAVDRFIANLK